MKYFFKLFLGFNLISLVHILGFRPGRFLQACQSAFGSSLQPKTYRLRRIPEITLEEILGNRVSNIKLTVMRYEDGMLPNLQAMALVSILVAEAPLEVLEIGTYMGHTTRQMAENLDNALIHTVDLPLDYTTVADSISGIPKDDFHLIERRDVGREYKTQPCASRIKQHFADTATWNFKEAGQPTFFFIDGSHTYEHCKHDSEQCYELCGGRGIFLWHDCDEVHPGVEKFIHEWRELGRDIKVISGTPIAYWKASDI